MKIIGLTGGIGSGKSTIAKMFEVLGVPVYYADKEAKKLMSSSESVKKQLISVFGNEAFISGTLNRAYIANIVFKDPDKLHVLNNIVHPEVAKHFENWVKNQKTSYVIQENAIIFENNKQHAFDDIITVTAPESVKIERVMHRDKVSKDLVIERMQNQLDDGYKVKRSKYIIQNTDLKKSEALVFQIHQELSK